MKKIIMFIFMFTLCLFIAVPSVQARQDAHGVGGGGSSSGLQIDSTDYNRDDPFDTNCADVAKTLQIAGKIIFLVKIILPLVIIVKYSVDLFKLVMSGDQGLIAKTGKKLGISLVAAIIIFYLPIVVNTLFGLIKNYTDNESDDSKICAACILDPYNSTCTNHIK